MVVFFVFDDLYLIDLVVISLVLCYPRFIISCFFFLSASIFDFLSSSQEIGWEKPFLYDVEC